MKKQKNTNHGYTYTTFEDTQTFQNGVSADIRDSTHDMLKSIDEHAVVLQNNLH